MGDFSVTKDQFNIMTNFQHVNVTSNETESITKALKKNVLGCEEVIVKSHIFYARVGHSDDVDREGDYMIFWEFIPSNSEYTIMA